MTDHLRRYIDYDLTLLPGAWRPTYDPRRKCYVLRWCQHVGLQHPIPTPNEALGPAEEWTKPPPTWTDNGLAAAQAALAEQYEQTLCAIEEVLRRQPLTAKQLAEHIDGYSGDSMRKLLRRHPDRFEVRYKRNRQYHFGVKEDK